MDALPVTYPGGASSPVGGTLMRHSGFEYAYLIEGSLTLVLEFDRNPAEHTRARLADLLGQTLGGGTGRAGVLGGSVLVQAGRSGTSRRAARSAKVVPKVSRTTTPCGVMSKTARSV